MRTCVTEAEPGPRIPFRRARRPPGRASTGESWPPENRYLAWLAHDLRCNLVAVFADSRETRLLQHAPGILQRFRG